MPRLSRRKFLQGSLTLAGGAILTTSLAGRLTNYSAGAARGTLLEDNGQGAGGYRPLVPSPDCPDLALPADFRCRRMGEAAVLLSDGAPTPGNHDGMAAFALPNGNVRLVRNHELFGARTGPPLGNVATAYDPGGPAGTTSLEIRPSGERDLDRQFISLNGTLANCAGGPTPWGSWLSCEETTLGVADGWARNHGYVFEVSIYAEEARPAVPLPALGRFQHEAVAVDPATWNLYLTEDQGEAGFYRFLPHAPGRLAEGGQLQMLAVAGEPNYNTRWGQKVGQPLSVEWVNIDDPDPASVSGTNPSPVYEQGAARGGALFRRLEGAWFGEGAAYFTSTTGGDEALGQVWEYWPEGGNGGELKLIYESALATQLNMPDNLCVTPRGGLLLCEDNDDQVQHLRGLTPTGQIFPFAQNLVSDSEFTGATFSPDGETLFVNLQTPGATYAIWGPWANGLL